MELNGDFYACCYWIERPSADLPIVDNCSFSYADTGTGFIYLNPFDEWLPSLNRFNCGISEISAAVN